MTTHGLSRVGSKTYRAWLNMRSRCNNSRLACAKHYSERGITCDPSWNSFEQFVLDMGESPEGLTLERRDNNKGYSKNNCYWATRTEQVRNQRSNKLNAEIVGEIKQALRDFDKSLSDNARNVVLGNLFGVNRSTIAAIDKGRIWKDIL